MFSNSCLHEQHILDIKEQDANLEIVLPIISLWEPHISPGFAVLLVNLGKFFGHRRWHRLVSIKNSKKYDVQLFNKAVQTNHCYTQSIGVGS